jgi:TonB family protein
MSDAILVKFLMYFDFEDNRPDTPTLPRPLSQREIVMMTIIVHLLAVITILVAPTLPFVRAAQARRQQTLEEQRLRDLERMRQNARFVFVEPRIDLPAPKPPPEAPLSDLDRRARTRERAPNPTNTQPFSRGDAPEPTEAIPPLNGNRSRSPTPPSDPPVRAPERDPGRQALPLPEVANGAQPPSSTAARQEERERAFNVLADAIQNVQKYAPKDGSMNLRGGADQQISQDFQFDTKGIDFGYWLARFRAQIYSVWEIPESVRLGITRGRVVLTFFVHKDGRITDVQILRPAADDALTRSARNAILASNPTMPLPPPYPDDRAFFTVTFYFNERPDR